MKEIQITERDGIQTINARKLWKSLDSKQEYAHWIKNRISSGYFTQSIDYIVFDNFVKDETAFGGKRKTIDYFVTIDMAKELCMLENTEKGKEVRKYLELLSQKEINKVKVFENLDFGKVSTVLINNLPYFKLVDVCNILGLGNSSEVKKRLDSDGVIIIEDGLNNNLGGNINSKTNYINESNLYDVILDSRKPFAKKFRKWIINDVIPSIRKDGIYLTDNKIDEILNNPDTIIRLAMQVKESRQRAKELENKIEEDKPKVEFFEKVADSTNYQSMQSFSKAIGIGSITLFSLLREKRIFYKQDNINLPYQQYIDSGYFVVKEEVFKNKDKNETYFRIFITGKGQQWLERKLVQFEQEENN